MSRFEIMEIDEQETIRQGKKLLKRLRQKWDTIRNDGSIKFPEYTEWEFEKLEFQLNRKGIIDNRSLLHIPSKLKILQEIHLNGKLNFDNILVYCDNEDKLKVFGLIARYLGNMDYWELLRDAYTHHDRSKIPIETLYQFFCSKRPMSKTLMTTEENKVYTNLPNTIKVYRAMSREEYNSKNYRLSWSLNKDVAQKFKAINSRTYQTEIIICKKKIHKVDTIAYFNGRNEEEIIYIPKKIQEKYSE